jgi:hypothetical protein
VLTFGVHRGKLDLVSSRESRLDSHVTAVQLPRRRRLPRIRLSVRSVMLLVLALACWLGTRVTDEGALAIEESLPEVQVLRDEDVLSPRLAPRAAADFDFARSQPVRLACRLLVHRARVLASHRDSPQLSATVHALCDLEATDKYSLLKLAQARAECLGILEPKWTPTLTASEREALEHRCAESGIAALSLAVDRGYTNLERIEGNPAAMRTLWNLRNRAGFAEIVARVKVRRGAR